AQVGPQLPDIRASVTRRLPPGGRPDRDGTPPGRGHRGRGRGDARAGCLPGGPWLRRGPGLLPGPADDGRGLRSPADGTQPPARRPEGSAVGVDVRRGDLTVTLDVGLGGRRRIVGTGA